MENALRYNRAPPPPLKQRRSGYEPSDTESEWQESPLYDLNKDKCMREQASGAEHRKTTLGSALSISPLGNDQRYSSMPGSDFYIPTKASKTIPAPRSKSKSPYRTRGDDGVGMPPKSGCHLQRNGSPLAASERQRPISPYEVRKVEANAVNGKLKSSCRKTKHRSPYKLMAMAENSRMNEGSNCHSRSMSAPKLRACEKEQRECCAVSNGDQSPPPLAGFQIQKQKASPYARSPPSEINEMIANAKLSKNIVPDALSMESTESIPGGDIFFSRDITALHKTAIPKNIASRGSFPPMAIAASERNANIQQRKGGNNEVGQKVQASSVRTVPSQRITHSSSATSRQISGTSSSSAMSRQFTSKTSSESSKMANGSRIQGESFRKFVDSVERRQKDKWFFCVKGGACRKAKSPETKKIDEAAYIEKALVVEKLREFWADKHSPSSLNEFICHKPQAQHLKQLVSFHNCPHLLFRGPSGSGKKALSMALLGEIFGPSSCQISNDLRYFHIQEAQQMQVMVPVTSSPHHVELNLKPMSGNARYALMALAKEIASKYAPVPEFSDATLKADYQVMVLYEVDKLADDVQHLIKWIIDCYTDACKIILCCEDDSRLLESIKSRCKIITLEAPVTHEIMEVLIQIAKKENFDLPMSFAAKIATKSKQNLRNAIMALEACKAHNYPFTDDQPIPIGWEEVLVEIAAEILLDPSPKRVAFARGKIQRLLVDFVHPKLILQKLIEQFLRGVEASLKREIYYWHAYYDKRLPSGAGALLKLEEFVAKFMSIYRRSFSSSLHPEE